jgi:hypothetical protein
MSFRSLECVARRSIRLCLLAVLTLGTGFAPAAADSLYDVAKVSVDTTAKNAVAARATGMAEAQQRALKILLGRIVPLSVQGQLPTFTQEEVEGTVIGVAVRKEQTSTTRYVAVLDVRFNPYAVKQLLADYAIPVAEDQAPAISLLPVMLAGDSITGEGDEGWYAAWDGLDLSHSVTPLTLQRPRADLDAGTVKAALAGDKNAFAALQSAYGYGGLVIAAGEIQDGKFRTRLAGEDAVGAVTSDATVPAGGNAAQAARTAAAAAHAVLENRWQTMQQGAALPPGAAYEEDAAIPGAEAERPAAAPGEVPRNVVALVEFNGLKDWQEIRSRLTQIAGLQALEVNTLSARGASVTFDFAGSLNSLQAVLAQNGFALHERDGTFVVRSQ